MADDSVARKIQRKLRDSLSEHITVGAGDDTIYLSGHVRSRAERQLAEEIARSLAEGVGIENNLAVERVLPDDRIEVYSPDPGESNLYEDFSSADESDGLLNPEFSGQPLAANPAADASVEENPEGDDALVDAVRQALADDATTTALQIEVTVERGVAHLRGHVTNLVDAENAEGVASEVPGIREVVDETTVEYP